MTDTATRRTWISHVSQLFLVVGAITVGLVVLAFVVPPNEDTMLPCCVGSAPTEVPTQPVATAFGNAPAPYRA